MSRVVLAMSGGVDSSVAAHLLKQAGHEVIGVFMRHGEASASACRIQSDDATDTNPLGLPVLGGISPSASTGKRADHKQGCCSATDAADARRVAMSMDIPFYSLDLQEDFRKIVDYFVDDYLNARTPNPCVKCNHWIKFGKLFDYADGVDADYVATGHYARISETASGRQLHRGLDDSKDQSYALFGIGRERLSRMMLPVGDYEKSRIREIAASLGLGVSEKKDSQEICFVTDGHHSDFVKSRRPEMVGATAGEIVTIDGRVVGEHDGFEAFTVGQRKGLGVALGKPHFVVRIEPETRRVVLGDAADLLAPGLQADQANWLIDPSDLPEQVSVQIRYNGRPHAAQVELDAADASRFEVKFTEPQKAVAPGQAAVVYDGDRVLGGGWIVCPTVD
ncbi:tRNA 2-thiouridine(34) synthase MnmA [Aporhodopirellula aestuarii]|uniref:tRNA-specific 2-thiouridylase MnmA n=1 Tax=Aporhodopirellula aestuarii TaxID=2950107 RepID=A0ABT0U2Q8_9BACT|nr:tRNA 2-thiouridine(34) synthase MnmA [Aporhodopirellula aestuarii]MCM2371179.1 tRNA 2-thiouridine(34) synthase MnmA [Aporhodopirellula aestuarii]